MEKEQVQFFQLKQTVQIMSLSRYILHLIWVEYLQELLLPQ